MKANFPNAKITFDKFHVIKLVNEAVDEVRRTEAKHNDWIKGTRYLWLKNLQNLDEEEKASIVRLEAANLDTMQAWQIRITCRTSSRCRAWRARGSFSIAGAPGSAPATSSR